MPREIEFTRENYVRLFTGGIYTLIENVKLGEHQFEKLREKKREYMLTAMLETLREPHIIGKTENKRKLYIKSFKQKNNIKCVVSVVVDKGNLHVSITSHIERLEQVVKVYN